MDRRPLNATPTRRARQTDSLSAQDRSGSALALFAILLPVLLAIVGLVLDGGELLNASRVAQHAADAAATAAAKSLQSGNTDTEATTIAEEYVRSHNALANANVVVSIPPLSGPLTGDPQAVEVEVTLPATTHFLAFLNADSQPSVHTRSVARYQDSTAGAALVVLDPDPAPLAVPAVGTILPALPTLVGGLEILGFGRVRVDGAVLVNTGWGGVDEERNPAGDGPAPPAGIAAPGLLVSERLQARDIRVVGGVDDPSHFGHFVAGESSPLRASRLPVDDPLIGLPAPTLTADPVNVSSTLRGGVRIADVPLIDPPRTLQPGVYDYLQILSGDITFRPGIYIIRDVDPATGIGLSILGGRVSADGVMFYITSSAGYTPGSGLPDDADGQTVPLAPPLTTLVPSTVILASVPGSFYRGLDDPSSIFDGLFLYQRRTDRRPMVVVNNPPLGGAHLDGTIYAKWGHLILSGSGFRDTRAVAGTMRLLSITPNLIAPANLLPPAQDVFLVE